MADPRLSLFDPRETLISTLQSSFMLPTLRHQHARCDDFVDFVMPVRSLNTLGYPPTKAAIKNHTHIHTRFFS